jgi:uncharacterized protein (DUF924 family)
MAKNQMMNPQEVLDFWFGPKLGVYRSEWFKKDSVFDQDIKTRFLETYELAAAEKLNAWKKSPEGTLALIIVLDQFPRNMFRGNPRAFATDTLALRTAMEGVRKHFDQRVLPVQRSFYYLPYEHSEKLAHQKTSVQLFQNLERSSNRTGMALYALKHFTVIKKFGRFPHRNSALGRKSTPSEEAFISKVRGF